MVIDRRRARLIGSIAVLTVVLIQAVASFFCHGHDLRQFIAILGIFILIPLVPALLSLPTANPLRALGACLLFLPWLLAAFHLHCLAAPERSDASLIHVSVLLWGAPSSLLGALITGPILRRFGVAVGP